MEGVSRWTDTIAACITPPGRGAVAVVRVSGPQALAVARVVAPFALSEFRHAYYGKFSTGDDGLCTLFAEGASFTGEDSAELSGHGSPVSVKLLLEACYCAGARPAERGEFSLRAFLNGQIDLSQAEGIRETVDAVSTRQLNQANHLRSGRLAIELAPIVEGLRTTLTTVEALTDFSEEIGELDDEQRTGHLIRAIRLIDGFLSTEQLARQIRYGALVVLAGRPNAGKSSLMNALLKSNRAIVTPIPGTTRDTIEEAMEIDGMPIRLVDTAGIRESGDEIEQIGIGRTLQMVQEADVVLYLYDSAAGWQREDEIAVAETGQRAHVIAAKCDLAHGDKGLPVSSATGEGLSALVELIGSLLGVNDIELHTLIDRHFEVVREVQALAGEALHVLQNPTLPDDLAAVTLRAALRKLGELTGETAPADVLERIFSQFCIGK